MLKQSAVSKDRPRSIAVSMINVIFLIICFDGTIRKYIFPNASEILLLMRDPFVIFFYGYCLISGLIKLTTGILISISISISVLIAVLLQLSNGMIAPTLIFFGIRQYISLLPMPFFLAQVLLREDIERLMRMSLWILIAMTPLAIAQALTPLNSVFNVGRGLDDTTKFTQLNYGDFARASGFFTSTSGYSTFGAIAGAATVLSILSPERLPMTNVQRICAVLAMIIIVCVSGSRTLIMSMLIVFAFAVMVPGKNKRGNSTYIGGFIALFAVAVVGLIVYQTIFSQQYQALQERWSGANLISARNSDSDVGAFSIVIRALGDFAAFTQVIPLSPIFGFGMGLGTNAGSKLALAYGLPYAESDFSRHVVDVGPIFGTIYIIFRVCFTVWLVAKCYSVAKRQGDPLPLIMFSSIGLQLLYGQISGNSTIGGLTWLWVGIVFAACRNQPKQILKADQLILGGTDGRRKRELNDPWISPS